MEDKLFESVTPSYSVFRLRKISKKYTIHLEKH